MMAGSTAAPLLKGARKAIDAEMEWMNRVMAGMATIILVGLKQSETRENAGGDEARTASALG